MTPFASSTCQSPVHLGGRSRCTAVPDTSKKNGGARPPSFKTEGRTRLLLFALGRHRFDRQAQELADTRVLLTREAFQGRPLIRGDADGDLPVRIARGLAATEIESGDCGTNDLACGIETMPFSAGLDSRDERFGKIKREGGRRLARCFCHTTAG